MPTGSVLEGIRQIIVLSVYSESMEWWRACLPGASSSLSHVEYGYGTGRTMVHSSWRQSNNDWRRCRQGQGKGRELSNLYY